MSPLSATISRVNRQHCEALIGIGLPILAASQLIPPIPPPPTHAKVSIDTIVQLLPLFGSGLIAVVKVERENDGA
jgi:hypothetical protein